MYSILYNESNKAPHKHKGMITMIRHVKRYTFREGTVLSARYEFKLKLFLVLFGHLWSCVIKYVYKVISTILKRHDCCACI